MDHPLDHTIIGSTQDDAAGECFDKCAKLLGLGYPGGPIMDRLATQGNPEAYTFARPMLNQDNHDFSFSGLKTSVRYFLEKHPELAEDHVALPDLCASIQAAIVEVLVKKTSGQHDANGWVALHCPVGLPVIPGCARHSNRPAKNMNSICKSPRQICARTTRPWSACWGNDIYKKQPHY